MKILLLNQDWFADDFRACGHEVVTAGTRTHLDLLLEFPIEDIHSLLARLPNGFYPDRIVVYDESAAIFVSGLEDIDIPLLFYSVDTHHHKEIHKHLAAIFDLNYVAHKDYVEVLKESASRVEWLPLWASCNMTPSDQKEYGAVFVGSLNAKLNPERVHFFTELQKVAPVLVKSGDFSTIFPKSEIVINQTVKGDLNFRVFEAMMSGAMLLTEDSENGLHDLFESGTHLVTYKKNDVQDAAEKIKYYLEHKEEAKRIANAGRSEILRLHSSKQRAERILNDLEKLERTFNKNRHYAIIPNYIWGTSILEKRSEVARAQVLECALKSINQALENNEEASAEIAPFVISACLKFDKILQSDMGQRLLEVVCQKHSEMLIFQLAYFWMLQEHGQRDEVIATINQIDASIDVQYILDQATELINTIMQQSRTQYPSDEILQCR